MSFVLPSVEIPLKLSAQIHVDDNDEIRANNGVDRFTTFYRVTSQLATHMSLHVDTLNTPEPRRGNGAISRAGLSFKIACVKVTIPQGKCDLIRIICSSVLALNTHQSSGNIDVCRGVIPGQVFRKVYRATTTRGERGSSAIIAASVYRTHGEM